VARLTHNKYREVGDLMFESQPLHNNVCL